MKKKHNKGRSFLTVAELARMLDLPYEGNGDIQIHDVANLEDAKKGDLVFCAQKKMRPLLDQTKASAAIVFPDEPFSRIPVIKSDNPHHSFILALNHFFQPYRPEPGIHPQAVVSPSARIAQDVSIGAFAVIGDETVIGEGTVIFPLVSIYPGVKIGKNVVIHSLVSVREDTLIGNGVILHCGAVIGSDGFGYLQSKERNNIKIPQTGTVTIEDDVEIGANTAVDRAALGKTVIKKGVKVDNLVLIAHNVEIGENSILAGQTGIAGSSKVGKNVILSGQVGVSDHVVIENDVIIAAQSGVSGRIPAKSMLGGSPGMDLKTWLKAQSARPHLYDLIKEVKRLRKRIEELEKNKK